MNDGEYKILIEILLQCIEANKGVEAGSDDRILDAESLAIKLFNHSATIKYIYGGTPIPNHQKIFFDLPSLNVIARAIIENFLVFHYVYIQPKDKEEENFRYLSYWLSGLIERQKYPLESPQGKELIENEKKIIDHIVSQLNTNRYYLALSNEFQKKIISRGEWRLHSWADIGISAKLNETYAKAFYRFLCGYAHSGNLSIRQLHQAIKNDEKIRLFAPSLSLVKIAIANMIVSYCKYFPKAQTYYNSINHNIVQLWIDVGSTDMKDVEVDWSKLDL